MHKMHEGKFRYKTLQIIWNVYKLRIRSLHLKKSYV